MNQTPISAAVLGDPIETLRRQLYSLTDAVHELEASSGNSDATSQAQLTEHEVRLDEVEPQVDGISASVTTLSNTVVNNHGPRIFTLETRANQMDQVVANLEGEVIAVTGKTTAISYYTNYQAPPTTVVSGHLDTNFVVLYDGFGRPGKLTFPNMSVQTTAFTATDRVTVDSIAALTARIQALETSVAALTVVASRPIGEIRMWGGANTRVALPTGWMYCSGQLVSKSTYSELYAVIGDSYQNGRTMSPTSFFLPDTRNLFVRGTSCYPPTVSNGANYSYTFEGYNDSTITGEFSHQRLPDHGHSYIDSGAGKEKVVVNVSSTTHTKGDVAKANEVTRLSGTVPYETATTFTAGTPLNSPLPNGRVLAPACISFWYIICVN